MTTMSQEAKNKLKLIPRRTCAVCGTKRGYTNPMAECFECKKDFCFDHINGLQVAPNQKTHEPVRDVCEKCVEKFNYKTL